MEAELNLQVVGVDIDTPADALTAGKLLYGRHGLLQYRTQRAVILAQQAQLVEERPGAVLLGEVGDDGAEVVRLLAADALAAVGDLHRALPGEGVALAVLGGIVGIPMAQVVLGLFSLADTIGYTPDVFMGPLMGWLLDRSPGAAGHYDVFAVVTGFALLGIVATLLFRRVTRA